MLSKVSSSLLQRSSSQCMRPLSIAKPMFDAEASKIYTQLAEQHRHPDGPWPLMLSEVIAVASQHSGPMQILDVASGMGEPALTIAKTLPNATILSTDFSQDMVDMAVLASKDFPNLTCSKMDAEDMSQLADNSQDVVVCCYGYMFPQDKVKALQESRRVLKEGGTLVATTWDNVDILHCLKDVMTAVLGKPPPPPQFNPMSLSEPGLFNSLLLEGGFSASKIKTVTSKYPFDLGTDKTMQFKMGTMLAKDKIGELGKWEVAETAFWANIGKYSVVEESGARVIPNNVFKMFVVKK